MKFLTYRELKLIKGIPYCRVHLRRMMRAGTFPQAVQLGPNSAAWVEEEVDRWSEERASERNRINRGAAKLDERLEATA